MRPIRAAYGSKKAERNRRRFFARSKRIEAAKKLRFCLRCGLWSKTEHWPSWVRPSKKNATCCKSRDLKKNRELKSAGLKQCWSCSEIKRLNDFPPNVTRGGENGTCKDCHKASQSLKSYRARRQAWIEETDDGTLTTATVRSLFGSTQNCPVCNLRMSRNDKQLDHKTPLSRGGAHSILNVWVICYQCNNEKGAKTLIEWMKYKEAQHQNVGNTERRNSRAGGYLQDFRDI